MVKDITFASLFDAKDMPLVRRLSQKINATHNTELITDFMNKCQKKVDDHNPILEVGNQQIEFIQVSKADDMVVTGGLNFMIDQILGTTVTRWQYVGKGIGLSAVAVGQSVLVAETLPRINMATTNSGWREAIDVTLRLAGIGGEDVLDIDIQETGIFTAATAGTMLNRNMFSSNPINHHRWASGFVISSVIELVPVI